MGYIYLFKVHCYTLHYGISTNQVVSLNYFLAYVLLQIGKVVTKAKLIEPIVNK